MQVILDRLYQAVIYADRWKNYLQGLQMTLLITVVALFIGIVIGVVVATVKIYAVGTKNPAMKFFNWLCNLYTTIIRGTPLMIQLLIIYSFSFISGGNIACFIGFGLNSGAYVSEIFRAGINSVDGGQMEAGRSLGLGRNATMRFVILPQAIKNVLPALFNEFIVLVKETSIAGYIAVTELTKMASNIKSRTYEITPLLVAAAIYLVLTFVLTQVQKQLERRYAKSDRNA